MGENKKMAEVSMIVPVYQVEKYIAQCIESVLNQTFKDFELILIDDGSKDQSGSICDLYAAKDDRKVSGCGTRAVEDASPYMLTARLPA